MKKLVNGCFGTIYYATVNEKNGTMSSSGRVVLTDDAIRCVFQWFEDKMEYGDGDKKGPLAEYSITFPSSRYTLKMTKTEDGEQDG